MNNSYPNKNDLRHPAHGSIRSAWPNTNARGPLTDKRIDHYIRLGYYGSACQAALLARDAEKKAHSPRLKKSKSALELAQEALDSLDLD